MAGQTHVPTKTSGQGTIISIAKPGATPGTFSPIGCITGWSLEASERNQIDTTCTSDKSKTFMFGLKDNGTLSIDLFWDEQGAGWKTAAESYGADKPYLFKIEYADTDATNTKGSVKTFEGYVTSFSETGGVDEVITSSISIKLTGDVTVVAPSH